MRNQKLAFLFFFFILIPQLFAQTPPLVSTEARELSGLCNLDILCDEKGIDVFLDNNYAGIAPLFLTGLQPGYYIITLKKEGFHPHYFQINLHENTYTKIFAIMEMITGFLELYLKPEEAVIETGGSVYRSGIIQLPVGQNRLEIRAFGFQEKILSVDISRENRIILNVELEPAIFAIKNWELSKDKFNPLNRGSYGQVEVKWQANAPGNAITEIFDMDGNEVFSFESPEFTDWYQSIVWDGRSSDGSILPDGVFLIRSTIVSMTGEESVYEAFASLDSSIKTRAVSPWIGLSGTQFCPFAETFAESAALAGLSIDYIWSDSDKARLAFNTHFGLSLADIMEIGLSVATNMEASNIAAALKWPFARNFAVILDGQYGILLPPSWLRSGVVFSHRFGIFGFSVFPALAMYFDDPLSFRIFASGAIELSDYWGSLSLSAESWSQSLKEGFAFRDGLSLGLGANIFLGNTPNILGFRVFTVWPSSGLPKSLGTGIEINSRL